MDDCSDYCTSGICINLPRHVGRAYQWLVLTGKHYLGLWDKSIILSISDRTQPALIFVCQLTLGIVAYKMASLNYNSHSDFVRIGIAPEAGWMPHHIGVKSSSSSCISILCSHKANCQRRCHAEVHVTSRSRNIMYRLYNTIEALVGT